MNGFKALKIRQICFFYIALLPVVKFFMMPSVLAEICAEDMWIAAAVNVCADLLTAIALFFAFRNEEYDFFTLIRLKFGKVFYKAVLVFYFAFFMMKIFLPLNEQKDYVELTLYMTTPTLLTFMPIFLVIVYIAAKKLRVLGRISDAVIFVAIAGYVFMFALSFSSVNAAELLPVGAQGASRIFYGAYRAQNWFGDGVYMLFFCGNFVREKHAAGKFLFAAILSGAIVVAFCITFYGSFGPIAFRQRFALTEISKYATVMNNIERFDFIAVFALLFVAIFSLCLPFFFAAELLAEIFGMKKIYAGVAVAVPFIVLLLFFDKYYASIQNFILTFGNGYFLFFGTVFPIVVALLLKLCLKKEKRYEI